MSFTSVPPPTFGVGKVLSDTFQVFRSSLLSMFVILGSLTVVTTLVPVATGGAGALVGAGDGGTGVQIAVPILSMLLSVVAFAACVQLVYEKGHGRPAPLVTSLSAALSQIIPLAILSIVFYIVLTIMTALLLVPGLWIAAVWAVTVPAIMFDRSGFGALGASAKLTKGYRWPIAGILLLIGIIALVLVGVSVSVVYSMLGISFGAVFAGEVTAVVPPGIAALIAIVVVQAITSCVFYGLLSAAVAAIYMRLKDIKEGGDGGAVAEVFQ